MTRRQPELGPLRHVRVSVAASIVPHCNRTACAVLTGGSLYFGLGSDCKAQRKGWAAIKGWAGVSEAESTKPKRKLSAVGRRRDTAPNLRLTSAWVAPLAFRGLLRRETIQESSPPSSDQILLAATLAGMH